MIRWSSIRGVRFAVLEDVIFVDLPGPRMTVRMTGARDSTAGKPRSRASRALNHKPPRSRSRGTRRHEQGGG